MTAPDLSKPANILRALFLVGSIALVVIGGGWALRKNHDELASIQNPIRYEVAVNALVPVFAIVHFATGYQSAGALAHSLLFVSSGSLLSNAICYGESNRCGSLPKVETFSNGLAAAVTGGWLAVVDPNWVFGPILKLIASVHGFFGLAAAAASVVGAIVMWSTESSDAQEALALATLAFLIVHAFLISATEDELEESPLTFIVLPAAVYTQFQALLLAVGPDADDKVKTGGAIIFGGMWIIWLYTVFRLKGPGITQFTLELFAGFKNLQFLLKLFVLIPAITITVIGAGIVGEEGTISRPLQWLVTSAVVAVSIIALGVLFAGGPSARKSGVADSSIVLFVFIISFVAATRRNVTGEFEKGFIQILVGMSAAGIIVINFGKLGENLKTAASNVPRLLSLLAIIINIVGCALWWDALKEHSDVTTVVTAFVSAWIMFGAHFGDEGSAAASYLSTILLGAYAQVMILSAALDERLTDSTIARHRDELVAGESLAFASIWILIIANILAHRETKGGSSAPAGMVASPSTEVVMETVQTA